MYRITIELAAATYDAEVVAMRMATALQSIDEIIVTSLHVDQDEECEHGSD